jgi:hypothetical protein
MSGINLSAAQARICTCSGQGPQCGNPDTSARTCARLAINHAGAAALRMSNKRNARSTRPIGLITQLPNVRLGIIGFETQYTTAPGVASGCTTTRKYS